MWEGPESVCGLADLGSRGERDGCCNAGCSHPPIKLQMPLLSEEEGLGGGVSDTFNAPQVTLSCLILYYIILYRPMACFMLFTLIQVHLNKLECFGKVHFSNSTQIVKLAY